MQAQAVDAVPRPALGFVGNDSIGVWLRTTNAEAVKSLIIRTLGCQLIASSCIHFTYLYRLTPVNASQLGLRWHSSKHNCFNLSIRAGACRSNICHAVQMWLQHFKWHTHIHTHLKWPHSTAWSFRITGTFRNLIATNKNLFIWKHLDQAIMVISRISKYETDVVLSDEQDGYLCDLDQLYTVFGFHSLQCNRMRVCVCVRVWDRKPLKKSWAQWVAFTSMGSWCLKSQLLNDRPLVKHLFYFLRKMSGLEISWWTWDWKLDSNEGSLSGTKHHNTRPTPWWEESVMQVELRQTMHRKTTAKVSAFVLSQIQCCSFLILLHFSSVKERKKKGPQLVSISHKWIIDSDLKFRSGYGHIPARRPWHNKKPVRAEMYV